MKLASHSIIALILFALPAFARSGQQIENFYRVDEKVYRGAQPSTEGFKTLADMGIQTVLDLRERDDRSRAEERVVKSLGMEYVNVPMTGLTPPTDAQIARILALLEDSNGGKVFVHCKRGADRTGAVIAAYRIDQDGWQSSRALKEAMSKGMAFYQFPRQSFIKNFRPLTAEAKNRAAPHNESQEHAGSAVPAMAVPAPAMP